jgi:hypothetical protein
MNKITICELLARILFNSTSSINLVMNLQEYNILFITYPNKDYLKWKKKHFSLTCFYSLMLTFKMSSPNICTKVQYHFTESQKWYGNVINCRLGLEYDNAASQAEGFSPSQSRLSLSGLSLMCINVFNTLDSLNISTIFHIKNIDLSVVEIPISILYSNLYRGHFLLWIQSPLQLGSKIHFLGIKLAHFISLNFKLCLHK